MHGKPPDVSAHIWAAWNPSVQDLGRIWADTMGLFTPGHFIS